MTVGIFDWLKKVLNPLLKSPAKDAGSVVSLNHTPSQVLAPPFEQNARLLAERCKLQAVVLSVTKV